MAEKKAYDFGVTFEGKYFTFNVRTALCNGDVCDIIDLYLKVAKKPYNFRLFCMMVDEKFGLESVEEGNHVHSLLNSYNIG